MVTHPCINQAHDCLTSVIKHNTFAPCCVSPCKKVETISGRNQQNTMTWKKRTEWENSCPDRKHERKPRTTDYWRNWERKRQQKWENTGPRKSLNSQHQIFQSDNKLVLKARRGKKTGKESNASERISRQRQKVMQKKANNRECQHWWRRRIKMNVEKVDTDTPKGYGPNNHDNIDSHETGNTVPRQAAKDDEILNPKPFKNYWAERWAIWAVHAALPATPRCKSKVLVKLITNSPNTTAHLVDRDVLLLPKAKKRLVVADKLIASVSSTVQQSKHVGTGCVEQARALKHAKAIASSSKQLWWYFNICNCFKPEPDWWKSSREQRKHRSDRIADDVKSEMSEFYLSVEISRQVPDKKQVVQIIDQKGEKVKVQKHLMVMTLSEAFSVYKKQHPDQKVSFTSFKNLKPKQVHKVSETSHRTCLCTQCCNLSPKVDGLKKFATRCHIAEFDIFKDISKQKLSDMTVCLYLSEDGIAAKCLNGVCSDCGSHLIETHDSYKYALKSHSKDPIEWQKVGVCDHNEERPTKAQHCMCHKKYVTARFLQGSPKMTWKTYTAYAFHASWQPYQLAQLLPNLKQDEVVAVMDFSENYHCTHQNEVQNSLRLTLWGYTASNDVFITKPAMMIVKKFWPGLRLLELVMIHNMDTALAWQFESKALDLLSQYMTVKKKS